MHDMWLWNSIRKSGVNDEIEKICHKNIEFLRTLQIFKFAYRYITQINISILKLWHSFFFSCVLTFKTCLILSFPPGISFSKFYLRSASLKELISICLCLLSTLCDEPEMYKPYIFKGVHQAVFGRCLDLVFKIVF